MDCPLHVKHTDELPVWQQIAFGLRILIENDRLPGGELLPSIAAFAIQLRVNPQTIDRAYRYLIELGLVETWNWQGYRVALRPPVPKSVPAETLRREALRLTRLARHLRVPATDAVRTVRSVIEVEWKPVLPEATVPPPVPSPVPAPHRESRK